MRRHIGASCSGEVMTAFAMNWVTSAVIVLKPVCRAKTGSFRRHGEQLPTLHGRCGWGLLWGEELKAIAVGGSKRQRAPTQN